TAVEFIEHAEADGVERLRVVGEGPEAGHLADALARPGRSVLLGPVLATGRREMLTVLREQAVSRTLHRFGHLPARSTQITTDASPRTRSWATASLPPLWDGGSYD